MQQQTYVADFKHNWAQEVLLSQQQRLQQDSTGAGFQGTRVDITKMNVQVIITSGKDKNPAQRKGQNPGSDAHFQYHVVRAANAPQGLTSPRISGSIQFLNDILMHFVASFPF